MLIINNRLENTQARYVVHGCNARGVMGAGVALALRKRWPAIYQPYQQFCAEGDIVGRANIVTVVDPVLLSDSFGRLWDSEVVVVGNLITQKTYGRRGKVYAYPKAIEDSLREYCKYVVANYQFAGQPFIVASSPIGCNNGGLKWEEVQPIFQKIEDEILTPENGSFSIYYPNYQPQEGTPQ